MIQKIERERVNIGVGLTGSVADEVKSVHSGTYSCMYFFLVAFQPNPKCETSTKLAVPLPWLAAREDQI